MLLDTLWTRLRREGSEGSKGSEGSEGRVDGALGPEDCGRLSAAGCVEGLCRRVLKMDRPYGPEGS